MTKIIEPSFGSLWNNTKYATMHAIRDSKQKGHKGTENIWKKKNYSFSQFEKDSNYRKLWEPHWINPKNITLMKIIVKLLKSNKIENCFRTILFYQLAVWHWSYYYYFFCCQSFFLSIWQIPFNKFHNSKVSNNLKTPVLMERWKKYLCQMVQ